MWVCSASTILSGLQDLLSDLDPDTPLRIRLIRVTLPTEETEVLATGRMAHALNSDKTALIHRQILR